MPTNWRDSFDEKIDSSKYQKTKWNSLEEPNDSLLDSSHYPESPYELDPDKVKVFIAEVESQTIDRCTDLISGMEFHGDQDPFFVRDKILDAIQSLLPDKKA